MEKTTGSDSLVRDLLKLRINGEDCDVIINVKGRAFRVNKCVIRERSPVFFSKLQHDMVENGSGTVDIPDCEPEAFHRFLEYLHTGELKDFSNDIVLNLYYIAAKYQVSELKLECLQFMSANLSFETFPDVAALSMRHNELELLESTYKFFLQNVGDISETDQWRSFMEQNTVAANEFIRDAILS